MVRLRIVSFKRCSNKRGRQACSARAVAGRRVLRRSEADAEAWASHKSFQPKDDQHPPTGGDAGSNPTVDFKGTKRSNDTHQSKTDTDARLYRKSQNTGAYLGYLGHALMENRNGLIVDGRLTLATGTAEREAALEMIDCLGGSDRITLGADKGYDTANFVEELRLRGVTPHVAQNTTNRRSAIDDRTTRHEGYGISQRKRKRVEEIFGWQKVIAGIRKVKVRGLDRVGAVFTYALAAFNLVRMRKLIPRQMFDVAVCAPPDRGRIRCVCLL